MAGNTLGKRAYFKYTSDTLVDYSILTDEDLGTAAGLTKDDTNPPPPRRFKMRGVYVEATVSGKKVRKFLYCQRTSSLFADASQSVTIDTTTFKTTGRRGEQMSYGKNETTAITP